MSIKGQSLGDFARNADGETYNGAKAAQWLFEAVTGKPMTDDEAKALVDKAKAKAEARRSARGA